MCGGKAVHAGGDSGGSWENVGGNPETDMSLNTGGDADSRELEQGGGKPSNIELSNSQEGRGDPTPTMLWSPERMQGTNDPWQPEKKLGWSPKWKAGRSGWARRKSLKTKRTRKSGILEKRRSQIKKAST